MKVLQLKIKTLKLLTLCCVFSSFSQSKINGKIVDNRNNELLSNVIIINLNTKKETISSNNGTFEVTKKGTYLLKKTGYLEKEVNLKKNGYHIIQLYINPSELNEVIINSSLLPKKLKTSTATINILSKKDINRGNSINVSSILNRTPAVFMQSGALNTNRITIRGVGSRNLFGTAKIRAYFKDIPLTTGSGETTIEDFELASMSRIEITKGASSIFGAGLGGVIQLKPQSSYLNKNTLNSEFTFGSFGLTKSLININHGATRNSIKAVYSNTHSDGYRDNNEYNRQTFTIHSNHFIGGKDDLSFLASFVDLKASIPSSLNKNTYLNNPKSAAFSWGQAQGFEDSQRGIFGLSWNHTYNGNLKQITSIFTSFRNGYEPRPFNILDENTFALGIRSRFIGRSTLFDKTLNWTIGGELFRDDYKSGTFGNLYKNFPEGHGSVQGNRLSDFKEKRTYSNVFFETDYALTNKTTFSIGLNFNHTSYDLDDRFTATLDNPDQSGVFKFKSIVSPKFGISHQLNSNTTLYSNISHGFSPISLEETLLPDGQINTDLKPETGWNYEVGSRGSIFKNQLQFNLAIYRLSIKNLLVAKRTSEDQFIGINAGQTQHDGLELELNYIWLKSTTVSLSSFASYSLNNYKFKDFVDDDNNYSGNDLTGVPSEIFNTGIDIDSNIGFYGNINFQHVGSMPITDNNNLFSSSYNLTNLKFGYKINANKKLKLNAFLGINNIFDEDYASQILINASGFGGNAPRYYYPGNPTNYYTGLNINYIF